MPDLAAARSSASTTTRRSRYALIADPRSAGLPHRARRAPGAEALRHMAERPDSGRARRPAPRHRRVRGLPADQVGSRAPPPSRSCTSRPTSSTMRGSDPGLSWAPTRYLTQPLEPLELIATVRALLRARRAEERARRIARRVESTFDAISDPLCLLDREGRVLRCNQAMKRFTGAHRRELIGRDHASFLPAAGEGARRIRSADGAEQGPGDRGRPAGAAAGFASPAIRCSTTTGSSRARCTSSPTSPIAQRVEEQREQLLAREQAVRGQLRGGRSAQGRVPRHAGPRAAQPAGADRATPLHDRCGRGGSREPPRCRRATVIERQVEHLARLVDDLLDVSRITRGKIELRKEPRRAPSDRASAPSRPRAADRRAAAPRSRLELPAEPLCARRRIRPASSR